jgi:hypothetical protein
MAKSIFDEDNEGRCGGVNVVEGTIQDSGELVGEDAEATKIISRTRGYGLLSLLSCLKNPH